MERQGCGAWGWCARVGSKMAQKGVRGNQANQNRGKFSEAIFFPGFVHEKRWNIRLLFKIQMEFGLPNGTYFAQIPHRTPHTAPWSFRPHDLMDYHIQDALTRGLPPFVVAGETNQRRELSSSQGEDLQKRILTYNRKEKSLAELSKKFLNKFEGASSPILALDEVTVELGVERRRIYDIINIMESLGVVCKIRKNVYEWKGLEKALQTIQFYKSGLFFETKEKVRKQKSLETLAGEFLRLFLTYRDVLTLDEATNIILTDADEKIRKTKIRRLYDIVNVFKCLGLVKKVHVETGKNGFQWLGVEKLKELVEERKNKNQVKEQEGEADSYIDEEKQNYRFDEANSISISKKSMNLTRRDTTILTIEQDRTSKASEEKRAVETPVMTCQIPEDSEAVPLSYFEILVKQLGCQGGQTVSGLHRELTGMVFSRNTR